MRRQIVRKMQVFLLRVRRDEELKRRINLPVICRQETKLKNLLPRKQGQILKLLNPKNQRALKVVTGKRRKIRRIGS